MLFINKDNQAKQITIINYGKKSLLYIYKGSRLVWQYVSQLLSCYANGYWIDQYPWHDSHYWKD